MASVKMIISLCCCAVALSAVEGHPFKAVSPPSLMTQYLREMCSFYAKEKEFPGMLGCNQDVIEDVKEHGENLDRPRVRYIPNWDGDYVEVYLNMARRPNLICNALGAPIKGACAVMEAVCTANENIMPCSMVTATPPTNGPTESATTLPTTTATTQPPPITA